MSIALRVNDFASWNEALKEPSYVGKSVGFPNNRDQTMVYTLLYSVLLDDKLFYFFTIFSIRSTCMPFLKSRLALAEDMSLKLPYTLFCDNQASTSILSFDTIEVTVK